MKLISIVTDRMRPLKKLAEKENYQFTLIADKQAEISKLFHAYGKPIDYEMINSELAIPLTYLVNRDGEIVWRYMGNKTDRPSIEAITEAIDSLLKD